MKKRVLISCVLLSRVMMLSCIMAFGASAAEATVTMTAVDGGAAVNGKVVTISSADELYLLRDYVAEGKPTAGVTFRLTADIALPNGTMSAAQKTNYSNSPDIGTAANPFKGIFDGNGKKISNLIISKNAYVNAGTAGNTAALTNRGVFAFTDGATVQNLSVDVASVRFATENIGGVIGNAKNTTLVAVSASGTVTANASNTRVQKNVGGLIGLADGCTLTKASSSVKITGLENVGGLIGLAKNTTLVYATSTATVGFNGQKTDAVNPTNFGGIVGKMEGATITNAIANASVYAKDAATDAAKAGGVAGAMDAGSKLTNVLVDVTLGADSIADAVVGNRTAGARIDKTYSRTATTNAVSFDADYKLSTKTEAILGTRTDNLFVALNLYVEQNKASYTDVYYFGLDGSAYTYVTCAAHTRPADSFACEDTACVNCGLPMAHTEAHAAPEGTKACAEGVKCRICNKYDIGATEAHKIEEGRFVCEEGLTCTECGGAVAAQAHRAANQAGCTTAQTCRVCGDVMQEALGHTWNGGQTCDTAEKCSVCGVANPDKPATGLHTADRDAPDCENPVKCTVCTRILVGEDGKLQKALGHDETGADPNCGNAKKCLRCGIVLADATGQHSIDWDNAEVRREPTPDVKGEIEGTCSVCGKTQQKYVSYEAPADDPADDPNNDPAPSAGLPTGALIGIIAGAVVVVGGGVAAGVVLSKKKKGASPDKD